MTSFSAGEIQVNALWKQGQLTIEDIINSRPRHLTAWFRDKPVEQVVGALPLIFNVCAVAQTVASLKAMESAQSITVSEPTRRARTFLVMAESARELGISLLQHWVAGKDVIMGRLTAWFAQCHQKARWSLQLNAVAKEDTQDYNSHVAALETLIIAMFSAPLVELKNPVWLREWVVNHHAETATLFNNLSFGAGADTLDLSVQTDLDSVLDELDNGDRGAFCKLPSINGKPRESGCFARAGNQDHNVFVNRLSALINDFATIPRNMRRLLPDAGIQRHGIGLTETARGTLLHKVELRQLGEQWVIEDYVIVAPTEWNFHPRGSLYSVCNGMKVDADNATTVVDTMIKMIDPCVSWKSEVSHA